MQLSHSLDRLGTETAFEVLARAKQLEAAGRRIVHLGIGAPDFDTPEHIKAANARALHDGHTAYVQAQGIPELREACAEYLSASRRLEISPDRIVVTPGAKPFLGYAVMATCDPGDEVIYPNPGFPIYESVIRYFGATPVPLPLREERGFTFTAADLAERITPRTKLIMLNSPANPTGGVTGAAETAELAASRRHRRLDPARRGVLRDGLRRRARLRRRYEGLPTAPSWSTASRRPSR